MSAPVRVIFLGGLGRSGTTLIERVLGELPAACALGEVVHLWQRDVRDDERCGCGARFSACPFWTEVGAAAFGGWAEVAVDRVVELAEAVERTRFIPTLARRRLPGPVAEAVAEYTGHYARVYRAAARAGGATAVVDSSKHASLAFCLRWCPEVDLRVVHVVRDSRGVAYSWTKRVPRPETDGADEMTRYTPTRSALLWNAHNAAFGALRHRGVAVLRLRYERFLDDPATAVRDIAAFADMPVEDRDLKFLDAGVANLGPAHTAAGNPMRFVTGPVPLRRDDAWRDALPAGQRRLVAALTAPLLLRYGYRLSGRAR